MSHGMWGSMPRHHTAMMSSIPAPYNALRNPLSRTRATVERGEVVYDSNCASCHGPNGAGDGEAGKGLNPPPGNLVWLSGGADDVHIGPKARQCQTDVRSRCELRRTR